MRVDGELVRDPLFLVNPQRARIALDDVERRRARWRTVVFHKPRGTLTTRSDPQARRTIYDVLGDEARGLVAIGRLDMATSGLLILTSDTQLANWIADPVNDVSRVYVVTVRGRVTDDDAARLTRGIKSSRELIGAEKVEIRKASNRETHLIVELREGKNREVRRLFEAIGREVTKLKRIKVGGLELGSLEPGRWREVSRSEIAAAFPGAPVRADG